MSPTLKKGSYIIYYQSSDLKIKRNDIVLFKYNNNIFIKRCIGIPKDSVYYYNQKLYTKVGKSIKEKSIGYIIPYQNFQISINKYNKYRKILSPIIDNTDLTFSKSYIFYQNYYYLRGDNIINSIDSEEFGLIGKKSIIGKYLFHF